MSNPYRRVVPGSRKSECHSRITFEDKRKSDHSRTERTVSRRQVAEGRALTSNLLWRFLLSRSFTAPACTAEPRSTWPAGLPSRPPSGQCERHAGALQTHLGADGQTADHFDRVVSACSCAGGCSVGIARKDHRRSRPFDAQGSTAASVCRLLFGGAKIAHCRKPDRSEALAAVSSESRRAYDAPNPAARRIPPPPSGGGALFWTSVGEGPCSIPPLSSLLGSRTSLWLSPKGLLALNCGTGRTASPIPRTWRTLRSGGDRHPALGSSHSRRFPRPHSAARRVPLLDKSDGGRRKWR